MAWLGALLGAFLKAMFGKDKLEAAYSEIANLKIELARKDIIIEDQSHAIDQKRSLIEAKDKEIQRLTDLVTPRNLADWLRTSGA